MTELWQQAAKWLKTVGVLDPACSAFAPNARVYDIAMALQVDLVSIIWVSWLISKQDGTVLCNAINKLLPGTIKVVHQSPEKQVSVVRMQSFLKSY